MSIDQIQDDRASASGLSGPVPLHRFSVEEYHRLGAAGGFEPGVRVELLDGWLVDMNPIGSSHRFTVQHVYGILSAVLPPGWDLFMQQPITLSTSEPQPDLVVVRGCNADYKHRHPGPTEVGLIIEVSESTLGLDRRNKLPIYAAAGIPQYWIINLVDREVEVCSSPIGPVGEVKARYQQREVVHEAGSFMFSLDGQEVCSIAVGDLLP